MAIALTLLNAAAATGASFAIQLGGDFMFAAAGTFGGASVALETLGPDGSTWIALGAAATFTAAGLVVVSIPLGTYRASITGGAGVSVSATLKSIA